MTERTTQQCGKKCKGQRKGGKGKTIQKQIKGIRATERHMGMFQKMKNYSMKNRPLSRKNRPLFDDCLPGQGSLKGGVQPFLKFISKRWPHPQPTKWYFIRLKNQ